MTIGPSEVAKSVAFAPVQLRRFPVVHQRVAADRACCSDDRCETRDRDDARGAVGHVHDVVGPVDRGGVGEREVTVATEDPNGRRLQNGSAQHDVVERVLGVLARDRRRR